MKELFEALENKRLNIIELYAKYEDVTNDVFEIVREMIAVDYKAMSDNKKIRTLKKYLWDVIETAFKGTKQKNYMLAILGVFQDKIISSHFCRVMKTKKQNFLNQIDSLYYKIVYWQGYEGCIDKKLDDILSCIHF